MIALLSNVPVGNGINNRVVSSVWVLSLAKDVLRRWVVCTRMSIVNRLICDSRAVTTGSRNANCLNTGSPTRATRKMFAKHVKLWTAICF